MSRSSTHSIALEGATNFRDLGGYLTADGRTVRLGRIYRSAHLSFVTPRDIETINGLGIRTCCDLRRPKERQRQPNRWHPAGVPNDLLLDVNAKLHAEGGGTMGLLAAAETGVAGGIAAMTALNRRMPGAFAGRLVELFDIVSDADHLPTLIHCAAGKDRTGFVCAMLLSALGVPRETVYEDYLLSAKLINREQIKTSIINQFKNYLGREPDVSILEPIMTVHKEYIDGAFDVIDTEYGSVENYLATTGGLTPALKAKLQALLLD